MCQFQVLDMVGEKNEYSVLRRGPRFGLSFFCGWFCRLGSPGTPRCVAWTANDKTGNMIFLLEGALDSHCRREVRRADRSDSLSGDPPSSPAVRRSILQRIVALPGISGRVLNTVEIAPGWNIAICEFHVSFRGAPAY